MKKKNRGFTLIELLIVIGIIAILASAVIVAINPGQQFEQARNATRWSHMNSLVNAIYSATISDAGNYPECLLNNEEGSWIDANDCIDDLVPDFINSIPEEPQVGSGDCSGYVVKLDGNQVSIMPYGSENEWQGEEGEDPELADCEYVSDNVTDLEVIQ